MSTQRTNLVMGIVVAALILVGFAGPVRANQDDYLPTIQMNSPSALLYQDEPRPVATSFFVGFVGSDPDGIASQAPTKYRYLLTRAVLPDGNYAMSKIEVQENVESLLSYADPAWSSWLDWPADEADQRIAINNLPRLDEQARRIFYLIALQAMDENGAVSVARTYGTNVGHFFVADLAPRLAIYEPLLGDYTFVGTHLVFDLDIGSDTYAFQWVADASSYGAEITSYRWGVDIADVDDPDDPGWSGPPGLGPEYQQTGPLPLVSGIHNLIIEATDSAGGLTRARYLLSVVPIPDLPDQDQLLLVDDVPDHDSNAWQSQDGSIALDNDIYRDTFWQNALSDVLGFDPQGNVIDTETEPITLRDLVRYRAVIWTSRYASTNAVDTNFRPVTSEVDRYTWLASYQKNGGNLLYAASRGTQNFLYDGVPYALPTIYESLEGNPSGVAEDGPNQYRVGFGHRTLPDGTTLQVGETRYPYRALGLSVTDVMSPMSTDILYGTDPLLTVHQARKPPCAGMKSIVLDGDFASQHMPGGLAFADTIGTEATIDWRDLDPAYYDDLTRPYTWGNDEFYENPGDRSTPFTYQTCADGPSGACIEPMFRSQSRFDWIREQHLAADPDDDWPDGYYTEQQLDALCGAYGLDDGNTSARTNDQTVGFLSYKLVADKPSEIPDVIWGFDPYRMDHAAMVDAIRWVLGDHFNLTLNR